MAKKSTEVTEPSAVVDTVEVTEPSAVVYVVAPGKSTTSKKGIIDQGRVVTAEMFSGGQGTFDAMIERGLVVKQ